MNTKVKSNLTGVEHRPNKWNRELVDAISVSPATVTEHSYEWRSLIWSGMVLGAMAGCASLMANVLGSVLWPSIAGEQQHPLRLIQVYLTFPLGEAALDLNSGTTLAAGCGLYFLTAMLYGVICEIALSVCFPRAASRARLLITSIIMLVVWLVNFYVLLIWLQPLLFGKSWIIQLVPWWVAAATHLLFGWTIAVLYSIRNRV